jgi:hypothetical protein
MSENVRDLVIQKLEAGTDEVFLDDFGLERVFIDRKRVCDSCGSKFHREHGGYGSICYECEEWWPEDEEDDDE